MTQTIVRNFQYGELTRIDTNIVIKNDSLGRPLEIVGSDQNVATYIYQNCETQIEIYKDSNGQFIHKFESIFQDGVLVETFFTDGELNEPSRTTYFDYKFDDLGYWIERLYEYPNGDTIKETRQLVYY